ncbi:MAG: twin-arginine translocation signal domain-containing protein [Candidatus Thiodiazotropha sp.]
MIEMADNAFDFSAVEKRLGVSRRTFLKFCSGVAASLGLPSGAAMAMADAASQGKRSEGW